jgi:hypothetical protein
VLEGHVEEGKFNAKEHSTHKAGADDSTSDGDREIDEFTVADLLVSDCHFVWVEDGPEHELAHQGVLVGTDLLTGHGLEGEGVVEMAFRGKRTVVDEVGVFGIAVGEKVEGFLFEADIHGCLLLILKLITVKL